MIQQPWYTYITGPLTKKSAFGLLAILSLGALLRLLLAYFQPAYIDEAFNYYISKPGWQHMLHALQPDNHTPAVQLMVYPLLAFSDAIFVLRLPIVLCGVLSLALSFKLLRRFHTENFSLGLCLFFSLSYQSLITDSELRPYAPLILCLLAVWNEMLNIYQHGTPLPQTSLDSKWRWLIFALMCTGTASFHMLGSVCLVACGLAALTLPANKRPTILCLFLGNIPSAAWFIWCRLTCTQPPQALKSGNCLGETCQSLLSVPLYLLNLDLRNWPYLCSDANIAAWMSSLLGPTALFLGGLLWICLLYGWWSMRQQKRWEADLLLLSLGLLPAVILVSSTKGYTLMMRYMVPLTMPFLLLIVQAFGENVRRQIAAFICTIAAAICLAFPFCPGLWNQYWQDTLNFINANRRPNDIIAVYIPYVGFSLAMAYDRDNTSVNVDENYIVALRHTPSPGKAPIFTLDTKFLTPELLQDLRGFRVILVIGSQHDPSIGTPVVDWFTQYYDCTAEYHHHGLQTWADIDTYILERR